MARYIFRRNSSMCYTIIIVIIICSCFTYRPEMRILANDCLILYTHSTYINIQNMCTRCYFIHSTEFSYRFCLYIFILFLLWLLLLLSIYDYISYICIQINLLLLLSHNTQPNSRQNIFSSFETILFITMYRYTRI